MKEYKQLYFKKFTLATIYCITIQLEWYKVTYEV